MTISPDSLHRTLKLELDSGRAANDEDAREIASGYVLQIVVGAGVCKSHTRQAALLTAVNAASRAFLGGVRVKLEEDFTFTTAWANGERASDVIPRYAGAELSKPLRISGRRLLSGKRPGTRRFRST